MSFSSCINVGLRPQIKELLFQYVEEEKEKWYVTLSIRALTCLKHHESNQVIDEHCSYMYILDHDFFLISQACYVH